MGAVRGSVRGEMGLGKGEARTRGARRDEWRYADGASYIGTKVFEDAQDS